jgi:hypothetical protein
MDDSWQDMLTMRRWIYQRLCESVLTIIMNEERVEAIFYSMSEINSKKNPLLISPNRVMGNLLKSFIFGGKEQCL